MAVTKGTTNVYTNGNDKAHASTKDTQPQPQPRPSAGPLPIVIAGGGCVGLFLALLLSHSTPPLPNPLIVLEPTTPDPTSTRAMAHQPPTYPLLSRIPGLLPELIETGSLSTGLCFRRSVKQGSGVIAEKVFENEGEGMKGKGQLLLAQGRFQEVLMRRLGERGVRVRIGRRVCGVREGEAGVWVGVGGAEGNDRESNEQGNAEKKGEGDKDEKEEEIEAAYLIGADGAHSTIRHLVGLEFPGETLDAQLVATDLHFDFHAHGFHDANFIIDPVDYGLIGRITPLPSSPHSTTPNPSPNQIQPSTTPPTPPLWRVSYGVPLGLSDSEIRNTVHQKLHTMLPDHGLSPTGEKAYTVSRISPYKPQQRLAPTLHPTRHTLLIGDAAHLTNPYAGLGLASGIADAESLSQILIHILLGRAADAEQLMQSWSAERRRVFGEVVDGPSRGAWERVRRDVSSEEKVEEFVKGDKLVGALRGGMPVKPGELGTRGKGLVGW